MSYVSPVIEEKFDTLPDDLKTFILERDVNLYTMQDLINELELIVSEGEDTDTQYQDTMSQDDMSQDNISNENIPIDKFPQGNMLHGD